MEKRIILAIYFSLLCVVCFSQSEWELLNNNKEVNPTIKLIEQTENSLIIKLSTNAYRFEEVFTPRGKEVIVISPEFHSSLQKGFPDIPIFTKSINIPDNSDFSFELVSSTFTTLENISIAPSKGVLYRNVNPDDVAYEYAEIYNTDKFFPENEYSYSTPFYIRDMKGLTLDFSPFIYNAVSKELKIYNEIIVKIDITSKREKSQIAKKQNSEEFNNIYNRFFLNSNTSTSTSKNQIRYTPLEEGTPGRMLIICKDDFEPAIQDFINWKLEKGIIVESVKMSSIGITNTELKAFIKQYYNTHDDLIYVLLVGDADGIPTNIHAGQGGNQNGEGHNDLDTDNEYAYIVGDDHYADVFIGRFSGNSIEHIETQVKRSIYYEKSLGSSDTWLETSLSSASRDGSNPSDVQHLAAIDKKLRDFGFNTKLVNEIGGSNAKISEAINKGVALVNYTGHGTIKTWVNTKYHNKDINKLINKNKLPFIWSVACLNGQFRDSDCFGEAWLQASEDGEPTGAIAFLGSTILQAWVPPMAGQNEMNELIIDSYENNIKRTIGGISFNGIFKIVERGGSQDTRTADTWTLFGDPSLMIRTKTPSENIVSHSGNIILGQNIMEVSSTTEGALATLSVKEDNTTRILGSGFINGGSVQISFAPISIEDEITLTVTAYNKITYQERINVIAPEGAYISQMGFEINDSDLGGNNNNKADYNEEFKINQKFKNVGSENASNLKAEITTEDNFITIIKNSTDIGELLAGESINIDNAFQVSIDENVEDQQVATLKIKVSDDQNNTWNSNIKLIINAPKLKKGLVNISNAKGETDISKGENISLKFEVLNIGHSKSKQASIKISSSSNDINLIDTEISDSPIDADSKTSFEFRASISSSITAGTVIPYTVTYTSGTKTLIFNSEFSVEQQVETWESNDLGQYEWINDTKKPWIIDADVKFQGEYSIKSAKIKKGEASVLKIKLTTKVDNDEIKFMKKVDSYKAYNFTSSDILEFYINDKLIEQWAGKINWSEETFNLGEKGEYELKWKFKRSYFSAKDYESYAWLDNIKLPAHDNSTNSISCKEIIENNSIEIFPNPASENINIRILSKDENKVHIKILNINGQIVYDHSKIEQLSEGENIIHINTENLINGSYIINILSNDYTHSKQLIINK